MSTFCRRRVGQSAWIVYVDGVDDEGQRGVAVKGTECDDERRSLSVLDDEHVHFACTRMNKIEYIYSRGNTGMKITWNASIKN